MPGPVRIPNSDTTSLDPLAVMIKDTFYSIQALGDDEAYYRIQGLLILLQSRETILDDAGEDLLGGAVDFVTFWKPIMRPILIENAVIAPALVDALEPAVAGDATAAEVGAGVNYYCNVLPSQIASGDDYASISQGVAAYLYYMLGKPFVDGILLQR